MLVDTDDTIAAIASAPGNAARCLIRLSGPETVEQLTRLDSQLADAITSHHAQAPANQAPANQTAVNQTAVNQAAANQVNSSLAYSIDTEVQLKSLQRSLPVSISIWPTERSYTRQPMAEIHFVGCPPIASELLEQICQSGIRLAGPGEFTLRAYLAGRIDLAQAEAVLGVIDAQSAADLDTALDQLAGGVGHELLATQDSLLNLLADLEAGLDFVEEDIEFISNQQITGGLQQALLAVEQHQQRLQQRQVSRPGFEVVLFGLPNVGKSSLFNRMARQSLANVNAIAGTTRDYLVASIQGEHVDYRLVDTAGLEHSTNKGSPTIESMSEDSTQTSLAQADVRILMLDGSRAISQWEILQLARCGSEQLLVINKSDKSVDQTLQDLLQSSELPLNPHRLSCETGQGIQQLQNSLESKLLDLQNDRSSVPLAAECAASLRLAQSSLESALDSQRQNSGAEITASLVRDAIDQLGILTGAVHTEDILGRIFGRFCIGK